MSPSAAGPVPAGCGAFGGPAAQRSCHYGSAPGSTSTLQEGDPQARGFAEAAGQGQGEGGHAAWQDQLDGIIELAVEEFSEQEGTICGGTSHHSNRGCACTLLSRLCFLKCMAAWRAHEHEGSAAQSCSHASGNDTTAESLGFASNAMLSCWWLTDSGSALQHTWNWMPHAALGSNSVALVEKVPKSWLVIMSHQQPKLSQHSRRKARSTKVATPPWMNSTGWLAWQTLPTPWPASTNEFSATDFINAEWADSLGHRISVSSGKKANNLQACLSKPKTPDILLNLKPVIGLSVWQCGNAFLDPATSTTERLCWLSEGGRVSVWVKLDKHADSTDDAEGSEELQSGTGTSPSNDAYAAATAGFAPADLFFFQSFLYTASEIAAAISIWEDAVDAGVDLPSALGIGHAFRVGRWRWPLEQRKRRWPTPRRPAGRQEADALEAQHRGYPTSTAFYADRPAVPADSEGRRQERAASGDGPMMPASENTAYFSVTTLLVGMRVPERLRPRGGAIVDFTRRSADGKGRVGSTTPGGMLSHQVWRVDSAPDECASAIEGLEAMEGKLKAEACELLLIQRSDIDLQMHWLFGPFALYQQALDVAFSMDPVWSSAAWLSRSTMRTGHDFRADGTAPVQQACWAVLSRTILEQKVQAMDQRALKETEFPGDPAIRGSSAVQYWHELKESLQRANHFPASATLVEAVSEDRHACPTCGLYYATKKALRQHQAFRQGQIQADNLDIEYKPEDVATFLEANLHRAAEGDLRFAAIKINYRMACEAPGAVQGIGETEKAVGRTIRTSSTRAPEGEEAEADEKKLKSSGADTEWNQAEEGKSQQVNTSKGGMRKASPAPRSTAPAKATDPARCASYHQKKATGHDVEASPAPYIRDPAKATLLE
ncbi:hypothetical protein AK812_SmicGene11873 [Symbiodinium microadriaticum]|uniref:Uncharacterized protein n=1 Tax=Symbiodinium microadriaticum TaxID=2951 RepID=A0A1Q9EC68_SYMMI|nr:hypothetical protein AK812_SmicGene11873 [Symbiodinium microadriaticum]